jgi:anaerobic selenocysteine-containing dehydrogenase
MGLHEPEFSDSDTDLIRQALGSDNPAMKGITFERLLAEGHVRLNVPVDFAPLAGPVRLRTPSGKIEFASKTLERMGFPAGPAFVAPAEAMVEENRRFPLVLLSPPEHTFLNSTFVNVAALAKAAGPTTVLLNPTDAARRGLVDGDVVRVWNDRGDFEARVVITNDVRPGVAASYGVRWPRLSGGKTVNDTTSQGESDLGGGALFYDNAVEVERVSATTHAAD